MEGAPKERISTNETVDTREEEPELIPRIYVADLRAYNQGVLHGVWLDAADDPIALRNHVFAMLDDSPLPNAEEWAIHDYEGFGGVHLSEGESMQRVARLATGIVDYGPAFAHWASLVGHDQAELERFEEAYQGQWPSLRAYAQDVLDDYGIEELLDRQVPAGLRPYVRVDADGFGRDLELSGDIVTFGDTKSDEGVYVYWPAP